MNRYVRHLRARLAARIVEGTTYCEECGGVCTAECRRTALIERHHAAAQRVAPFRF
jgi:hypothetical protein